MDCGRFCWYTKVPRKTKLVTLIQLGDDQYSDQCQQSMLTERLSHATDLAQCCKTCSDGVGDLCSHSHVSVDVDTKIPGLVTGDTKASPTRTGQSGSGVDVVTMRTRGVQSWLDLAAAGLPSSTPKPRSLQTDTCCVRLPVRRLTVTVNLGVVCIRTRRKIMFNELQQVGSVKEKQDRSEDRALWHSKENCRWHRFHRTGCRRANLFFLSLRYDVNQSMTFPLRQYDVLNCRRSVLWSTLSNAADRSSSVNIAMLAVSCADSRGLCLKGPYEQPSPSNDTLYMPTDTNAVSISSYERQTSGKMVCC